jgi:serine/threonine protein phosphatase PrpC
MGGIASCMSPQPSPSRRGAATVVYEAPTHDHHHHPAPTPSQQPDTVHLAFAYASRPGTLYAPAPSFLSSGRRKSFAARRQPLKPNQDAILVRPSYGGCHFLHLFGVFDGHGEDGAAASRFARDKIEALLLAELRSRSGGGSLDRVAGLSDAEVTAACKAVFLGTERALGRTLEVDDSFSGTTAVIVLLIGCRLFAASVGDSRAVLGARKGEGSSSSSGSGGGVLSGVDALTTDHNPYRADELARIQAHGGVVMTYEQMASSCGGGCPQQAPLDGLASLDPPRVWDKALTRPGCCFTRSLGDSFAKTLGVIAEPEVVCRDLQPGTFYLCLTSDGVSEFLTDEALLALVAAHRDRPLHACRAVCARSVLLSPPAGKQQETQAQRERRELLYLHRDDTTVICVHIHAQRNNEPARL